MGQGNFGSVDGDNAAAMRYTECVMARIGHQLLAKTWTRKPSTSDRTTMVPENGAAGPAGAHPQPAVNGSAGHRGRHGDQHPAAQPERGDRRLPGPAGKSGAEHR